MKFHTDPNAPKDAKPNAETFIMRGRWYWFPVCIHCGQTLPSHGPFDTEPEAIEDAQKGGA